MKQMKKLVALSALMTLFAGQVQGQDTPYYTDNGAAYEQSESASRYSIIAPVLAAAVIGVIIIGANRGHGHHSSYSDSYSSSSSHSHSGHFGCL